MALFYPTESLANIKQKEIKQCLSIRAFIVFSLECVRLLFLALRVSLAHTCQVDRHKSICCICVKQLENC